MKIKFALFCVFMMILGFANSQDTLITVDKDTHIVKVFEVGSDEIIYKKYNNLQGGPYYHLDKEKAWKISYPNGESEVFDDSESEGSTQIKAPFKWFDGPDLMDLLVRFGIDFFFVFIVIRLIYFPINKSREHILTFFIFNIVIFFVCCLLSSTKLKIGFAFGLFAVFSILRYRTEQIPIKEMTFLFLSITLAVINALVSEKVSFTEIMFTNLVIVGVTFFLERLWIKNHYAYKAITYEKIELIKPENKELLYEDLHARTGLIIHNVDILKINLLNDTAQLKVYYSEEKES